MNYKQLFPQFFSKMTLLLFISLGFSSCLKKQNLEDPQVGPAVTQEEMFKQLTQDIGQFGFDQIKKGEANVVLMSQIIEENTVRKLYQQSLYVKEVTTSPNGDLTYDFVQNLYYLPDQSQSIEGRALSVKSLDELLDKQPMITPPIYWYTVMATQWCQLKDISCHNLSVTNESFPLRPELAHPSICPDENFCEVKTRSISFDALELRDGKRQKVNYRFIVAPQLPFLSRVLKYCRRYVVKTSPRDYLEEICYDTSYFQVGSK